MTTTTTVVASEALKQNATLYNRYPVEMVINQFARGKSVSAASFKTTRAKDKIQIVCLAQLFVQDRVSAFCRIFFIFNWIECLFARFLLNVYCKGQKKLSMKKNVQIFQKKNRTKEIVQVKKKRHFMGFNGTNKRRKIKLWWSHTHLNLKKEGKTVLKICTCTFYATISGTEYLMKHYICYCLYFVWFTFFGIKILSLIL